MSNHARGRPDDSVGQNSCRAVDVGEEEIQRFKPLSQSTFDEIPIVDVKDSRDQINRNDPLVCPFFFVDRKRNSFMQKQSLGAFLHARDLAARDVIERLPKPSTMTVRRTSGIKHFVVEDGVDLITGEKTLTI